MSMAKAPAKPMERVNQAAVREVTRRLHDSIRSDWTFPADGDAKHNAIYADGTTSYRHRYYETTDEDDDDGVKQAGEKDPSVGSLVDPYRFDHPDDVGDALQRVSLKSEKRKRDLLEEEMEYNDGLRHFVERRNAWTGAVPRATIQTERSDANPVRHGAVAIADSKSPAKRKSQDSSSPVGAQREDLEMLSDVLIPVAPPLVPPDQTVRVQMNSRPESELYEKIVRDTRAPAIPINLAHMMRIIVQGWKDEGNWPPPNSAPEPAMAGRRRVKRAIAVRHENGIGDSRPGQGLLANHRHLRHGVDSMKKVFRLSGSHPAHPSEQSK